MTDPSAPPPTALPSHDLYYGGQWHAPVAGVRYTVTNPADATPIASIADAQAADIDLAVAAARSGFLAWRSTPAADRGRALRAVAQAIRDHHRELAAIDARNGGNPVRQLETFMGMAADGVDFFAGLVTEIKGDSIPIGPGRLNVTVREPVGVVARLVAFNHPLMFTATRMAAPIAAGNALILKASDQAPLSALRLAELTSEILPPGVFNLVTGGAPAGAALAAHPGVGMITLIGSATTARSIMTAAAPTLKRVLFELGGKNALIAFPDAHPATVAEACVDGMNFAWAGQSCGSTSRAFVHDSIHTEVVERIAAACSRFRPGVPGSHDTSMGAIVSKRHHERVLSYIERGLSEGATLVTGGSVPADAALAGGWFVEPTVFTDVTSDMAIANEEIFGPVLSVLRWGDEASMMAEVNALDYGLTCSIWTSDLDAALRCAHAVEAGYVWVNEVAKHFLGTPFGGYKQSGIGREESFEELLAFTQEKNIHVRFRADSPAQA